MRKWKSRAAVAAAAIPMTLLCSGAAAQLQLPPCPADRDGDGNLTPQDIILFLQEVNQGNIPDLNNDGVGDAFDILRFFRLYDQGCAPIALGPPDPLAAFPGQEVCIPIANFPALRGFDPDPDDLCIITTGGQTFQGLDFRPGLQNDGKLIVTPLPAPFPPLPGPIMIGIGDGELLPLPPLPGIAIPEDPWVWLGDPQIPPIMVPGDFDPQPDPDPDPMKKFAGGFFLEGGQLKLDLPAIDWARCDEIFVQFRAWCDVRSPDVVIPRIVLCEDQPTTKGAARAICDAIVAAFRARGINEIRCEIIDLGNGRCRICIGYTDCDITGPTWQFQGQATPFANICVTGNTDCDEVCGDAGPTIVDITPNTGVPGDIICIWVRPNDVDPNIDPKNLCILGDNGLVFEAKDVVFDQDRGLTKIFACLLQVAPESDGVPGRLNIAIGVGECNENPDPDPMACNVDPVWSWVPLPDTPRPAGGDFTGMGDPTTGDKFSQKWTLENGRQCLTIPGDFMAKRCSTIEILIRLWCDVRSPDVNIPSILLCQDYDARSLANLICEAITNAFLTQANPITEIDCQVIPQADGSFKVSIGYTDCDITGGTTQTGLPWTQVTICPDDPRCDELCGDKLPPVEIKDVQILGQGFPGEPICFFVCNVPEGKTFEDWCIATTGGQLFQVREQQQVDANLWKLTAEILPAPAGTVPGEFMIKCGDGTSVPLDPMNPNVAVGGNGWVWQGDPNDPPGGGGPGMGFGPRAPGEGNNCTQAGGPAPQSWVLDPLSGKLCLEVTDTLCPGQSFSIWLRAYCDQRSPDVEIPSVENIGSVPLCPDEVAQIICDLMIQAYVGAGIPEIECTIDFSGPFPVIKLGYSDCLVDGPLWATDPNTGADANPSVFQVCGPATCAPCP